MITDAQRRAMLARARESMAPCDFCSLTARGLVICDHCGWSRRCCAVHSDAVAQHILKLHHAICAGLRS